MTAPAPTTAPDLCSVPPDTGPPTREELLAHYPAQYTWRQFRILVNARLQTRYEAWLRGIREEYGSVVNYLLNYRLRWGKPDTLSALHSALDDPARRAAAEKSPRPALSAEEKEQHRLPPIPEDAPFYFTADTPPEFISICMNNWPYSDAPHLDKTANHPAGRASLPRGPSAPARALRLHGGTSPPPSPSHLPEALPVLAHWGIAPDPLEWPQRGTLEEDALVRRAAGEVSEFVRRRWKEREWETAWFDNPQRTQSMPGLAHVHVFARRKTPDEEAQWDVEYSQHDSA
ncbi:hypothetical protein OBBRIDRAFT_890822 [Obba rivulosa]|uniref:Uncharacterized protein n=1 Tax=Obba rivulosa TaxID=1052685 RepID=A0A8E2DFG8_9APHY|nr:hypothetical protein OBBRIDRAFT_890822 [Obba rivulosa]